jgi:hypothetical protein
MTRLTILAIACLTLVSCSLRLSHADGSTTYLGLVNLREGDAGSAPLVHSRRYGLMLDAGKSANGFSLGYDERILVRPPYDATTTLDYSPGNGDPVMNIQPES